MNSGKNNVLSYIDIRRHAAVAFTLVRLLYNTDNTQ